MLLFNGVCSGLLFVVDCSLLFVVDCRRCVLRVVFGCVLFVVCCSLVLSVDCCSSLHVGVGRCYVDLCV